MRDREQIPAYPPCAADAMCAARRPPAEGRSVRVPGGVPHTKPHTAPGIASDGGGLHLSSGQARRSNARQLAVEGLGTQSGAREATRERDEGERFTAGRLAQVSRRLNTLGSPARSVGARAR